jgi:hypothetical protein
MVPAQVGALGEIGSSQRAAAVSGRSLVLVRVSSETDNIWRQNAPPSHVIVMESPDAVPGIPRVAEGGWWG